MQIPTDDNFELYLGDSRFVWPDLTDGYSIITDPIWPNTPEDMFELDCDPALLLSDVLKNYAYAKRVVIVLRADSDPRFLKAIDSRWPFFRLCVLPYSVPGYLGRKLGGLEVAYCFGEPIDSRPGKRVIPGMAPSAQKNKNIGHPCPRNLHHMNWLVEYFSEPGEIVVDPFMGSGTTGMACIAKGRPFVGIEINEAYFDLAKKNIGITASQLRLSLV